MNKVCLSIGGRDVESRNTGERANPVTGEVATRYAAATTSDAAAAAAAASEAFPGWAATSPAARRHVLSTAATELEARQTDLVSSMVSETGATEGWAGFNVALAAGMFREAAAMTTQLTGEIIPSNRPGTTALALRKPVGPILSIAPWNAPVILGVRSIALPLACGNSVVFKGSEYAPYTQRLIVDALIAAGVPEGVVNYISNSPEDAAEIVEALVTHAAIRRINFTGSTRVGKIIASLAAQDLKPVLLELGGKAPLVILDDSEVNNAVDGAAFGAFFNQGQICMSTERVLVDESIGDVFVERFVKKARCLLAVDPNIGQGALGAVVDRRTVVHLAELIDDARRHGAEVVLEGAVDGVIMQPTIVDRVSPEMRLWKEESFGPIVGIARANGDDALVRLANDTNYGLSAAVYGSDISRLMSVAERIESGICHINAPTVYDEPQMPFGGVKESGYGRFGGRYGVDAFTEVRWITINTRPVHLPI